MKEFYCNCFYTVNSMSGLGKETKGYFYIQSLMYTHILILWIKGFQLFKIFMSDATHHKSFGSVRTYFNKLCRHILYILDYIYFLNQCIYIMVCLMLCFWFPADFWWKDFVVNCLHDELRVGVRKIIQKSILHKILYVYPHINFIHS